MAATTCSKETYKDKELIRSLESEKGSHSSKRSASSHSSATKVSVAAEAASLKAKLKYIDIESKMKADLERLETIKQLEVVSAKAEVLDVSILFRQVFTEFIYKEAKIACDPLTSVQSLKDTHDTESRNTGSPKSQKGPRDGVKSLGGRSFFSDSKEKYSEKTRTTFCFLCKIGHDINECRILSLTLHLDTCEALGLSGTPVRLSLSTMTSEDKIVNSQKVKGLLVRWSIVGVVRHSCIDEDSMGLSHRSFAHELPSELRVGENNCAHSVLFSLRTSVKELISSDVLLLMERDFKDSEPDDFGEVTTVELHHFSDASTVGYGQCSYVRLINCDNKIHCALLMEKSRVVPLRPITIPRLERRLTEGAVKKPKSGLLRSNSRIIEPLSVSEMQEAEVVTCKLAQAEEFKDDIHRLHECR
ncbi:hypothetical protein MAR_016829, partial [Mya arenaria]